MNDDLPDAEEPIADDAGDEGERGNGVTTDELDQNPCPLGYHWDSIEKRCIED